MRSAPFLAVSLLVAGLATRPAPAAAEPPDSFVALAEVLVGTEKEPADVASASVGLTAQTERHRPPSDEPLLVGERERADRSGRNDELDDAQAIRRLGTSARHADAVISGHLADVAPPAIPFSAAEDDGAIPVASPSGLSLSQRNVTVSAAIGDGPHGAAGTGTGDFDFFLVEDAAAGQLLTVDVDARSIGSPLDPVVAVVAPNGQILAFNDDSPEIDSFLELEIPADGDVLVAVAAFGSLPANPFDPASGGGVTSEGAYDLRLSYRLRGRRRHVPRRPARRRRARGRRLGGARARGVRPVGRARDGFGSRPHAGLPAASPLRVAATATLDHVAAVDGPHFVRVSRGPGEYALDLRVRRPGLETDGAGARQVLFLDFDGAFVDPSVFGTDSGDLSPLADFLPGWGLGPDDESALIDAIVATFRENLHDDPHERGGNARFDVDIRNSRDHADPWGEPNVTRIIIGGTREQLDFPTVGLAQSVDPGNFAREETGVVLLDQASSPAGSGLATINDFVTPGVDVVGLVGQIVGFIASHEAGHLLGNHHTAPENGVVSIMDTRDLTQLGLGPDVTFGTADDVDVDFVVDELIEGYVGAEDTMARVAFGLSTPPAR